MNLYRLNQIPVVVAEDLESAVDRYEAQTEDLHMHIRIPVEKHYLLSCAV